MAEQPLKVLEALGDELERVALADERRVRWHAARLRPRRRRTAALSLLVAAVLSGAALAASGLLEQGDPVAAPLWMTMNPALGYGTTVAGTERLTELRVLDPDGGPPWGLRTVRTTGGYGCVQVGRVVGGRLGVLGTDGAFGDDGRFHPFPTGQLTQAHCARPDDAGQAFLAISARGVPAGGFERGCGLGGGPACGRGRLRVLYFGLLGPKARAVTYRDDSGKLVEAPTAGREGAYLVVVRPSRSRPAAHGAFVPAASPGSGLASVRYAGAAECRIRSPRSLGGAKPCPMVGRVDKPLASLTDADVASPIQVRRGPEFITVTFRTRVDPGPRRTYAAEVRHRPDGKRCLGGSSLSPLLQDVRPGAVVTLRTGVNQLCPGPATGRVVIGTSEPGAGLGMLTLPRDAPVVGRFRVPPG